MAGLQDTDIRLSGAWQLTGSRTGDAPTCSGLDCFLQDVALEAVTQPGEVFYDAQWGWGLAEFLGSEDDEFLRLEIRERIKAKLGRRDEVDADSIGVSFRMSGTGSLLAAVDFADEQGGNHKIEVSLNRVQVEVLEID